MFPTPGSRAARKRKPGAGNGVSISRTGTVAIDASFLQGYISGLTLAYATTTTFTIATGVATDSAATGMMKLASSLTKSTGSWAAGSDVGSLDTGAIAANTWYHVYLIQRSDSGGVDVLTSLSAASPTMPARYDRKRRIGALKTNGSSQWTKWYQDGDTFTWDTPTEDFPFVVNPGTAAVTQTLNVPTGVRVGAIVSIGIIAGASAVYGIASDLSTVDVTPSFGAGVGNFAASATTRNRSTMTIMTNTSGQIRCRISFSDGSTETAGTTLGWIDPR